MVAFIHPDQLVPVLKIEMNGYERYLLNLYPNSKIIVHEDYADAGHVENSQHYTGRAVDFHVAGVGIADAWLALERFNFNGIGFYPYWNNPGFHADVRSAAYRARWCRDANGNYIEFGPETLRQILV